MSQIVKTFMGVFLLMMLLMLGCGIVSAQMESAHARDYQSAVLTELSDSGCNQKVIDSCMQQAKRDGYQLAVQVWERDGARTAEVTLGYEYRIPFLNYSRNYRLRGYAA